jgi:hypothetical protein
MKIHPDVQQQFEPWAISHGIIRFRRWGTAPVFGLKQREASAYRRRVAEDQISGEL